MSSLNQTYEEYKYSDNSSTETRGFIRLYFEDAQSQKKPISVESIENMVIHESIFHVLPYMSLNISDTGVWRENHTIYPGRKVFLELGSITEGDEYNVRIGTFRILTYTEETLPSGFYMYCINLIGDNTSLFTEIPIYPKKESEQYINSSDTVIRETCNSLGIEAVTIGEPKDYMTWFNPGLTGDRFLSLVISHANFGPDDFPIFWIDITGKATYSSFRSLLSSRANPKLFSEPSFYVDVDKLKDEDLKKKYDIENNSTIYLFSDFKRLNYSSFNDFYTNTIESITVDPNKVTSQLLNNELWEDLTVKRTYSYSTNKYFNNSSSTYEKPDEETENRLRVRGRVRNGYHFYNTHEAWEDSVNWNRLNSRALYFNQYWIRLKQAKQLSLYFNNPPALGMVLVPDLSILGAGTSNVENVNMLIHTIEYKLQPGVGDLIIDIRTFSDDLNKSIPKIL